MGSVSNKPPQINAKVMDLLRVAVKKGATQEGYPKNMRQAKAMWRKATYPGDSDADCMEFAGFKRSNARHMPGYRHRFDRFWHELTSEQNEQKQATKSKIDRELNIIAFADILDYVEEGESEDGQYLLTPRKLSKIDSGKRRAIRKITYDKDGSVRSYELYDKSDALDRLMGSMGMKTPEFLAFTVGQLIQQKNTQFNFDASRLSDEQLTVAREVLASAIDLSDKE